MEPHDQWPSLRTRLRACRSFSLTPASRPGSFSAARAAGADAVMVDLESTVAPVEKERAREAAIGYLRQPPEPNLVRLLRINSPRSVVGLRDLLALYECGGWPDAIIIPKCQSPDEVRVVSDLLEESRAPSGIVPMVELARAVFVAEGIAGADARVCGLFLGGGDLATDLGAEGAWENLLFARSCLVAAAATTGIAAIDVPYFHSDASGLLNEATASRKLGMTGKAALHTEQLAVINGVFTPAPDVVAQARALVAARPTSDTHAPVLNGHVVEPAMLREADRVLAIAAKAQPA